MELWVTRYFYRIFTRSFIDFLYAIRLTTVLRSVHLGPFDVRHSLTRHIGLKSSLSTTAICVGCSAMRRTTQPVQEGVGNVETCHVVHSLDRDPDTRRLRWQRQEERPPPPPYRRHPGAGHHGGIDLLLRSRHRGEFADGGPVLPDRSKQHERRRLRRGGPRDPRAGLRRIHRLSAEPQLRWRE